MNIKKKMSNKSIRGVIWHDIARGFYADRFRYLIAVLMLAGVLIILGNHEFGMMDTIFFIQGQCSREKRKTPHHRESVRQILRRQTMTAKNAEGYPDPTAEEAIRHVMRGGKLDYTSFRTRV